MKNTIIILMLLGLCYACAPIRALKWRQPDLNDSSKFAKYIIPKGNYPFRFIPLKDDVKQGKLKRYIDSMLVNTNTNSFLIIRNDSIIYEYYAEKISANSLHPSFSIAKSYIGTLVGIAIDKGIICSADDLVIKYIPELKKNDKGFQKLKIQHVLDMRSGLNFDEEKETPFSGIAKLYYGSSLKNQIKKLKMKRTPGEFFEYQSINTQLLAEILERASGEKIQDLLFKYLWNPLGAESNSIWSHDDQKTVKAFCCLNATALDYAKLGRLYLNKGNWEGQQLISKKWIESTTNSDVLYKMSYKNHWWAHRNTKFFKDSLSARQSLIQLNINVAIKQMHNGNYYFNLKSNDYRAEGILGQILYVNPDNKVIIVRLGDSSNKNFYFNGFIPQIGREL